MSTKLESGQFGETLKRKTDALIKDLGFRRACEITGKSKTTLGRYASLSHEHANRYIPIDVLFALECEASEPFVTDALVRLRSEKAG